MQGERCQENCKCALRNLVQAMAAKGAHTSPINLRIVVFAFHRLTSTLAAGGSPHIDAIMTSTGMSVTILF